ncbi:hypothetical protein FA95DRAFT_1556267 [Auriscalpium vulgare]|uniref:Uncharacterized protein n=1 Tax=Auriscalpium vulgare TaxID=40419 RepID=A0ACB8S062_9AGAM|nr:hypothetical protein FA95DRAFT_1556267 [Auriscalpium vulgare]
MGRLASAFAAAWESSGHPRPPCQPCVEGGIVKPASSRNTGEGAHAEKYNSRPFASPIPTRRDMSTTGVSAYTELCGLNGSSSREKLAFGSIRRTAGRV